MLNNRSYLLTKREQRQSQQSDVLHRLLILQYRSGEAANRLVALMGRRLALLRVPEGRVIAQRLGESLERSRGLSSGRIVKFFHPFDIYQMMMVILCLTLSFLHNILWPSAISYR